MADSLAKTAKTGHKRLWNRRWAKICRSCGTPVLFLDNPEGPKPGKKWSPWVVVEMYGERDGELMGWNGEIAYDPRFHVRHDACPEVRRRLAWRIRRATEDL
jgi:hypothetical protein